MNNSLPKKIVRSTFEVIKDVSRDAVQSLTGTGEYDMTGTHEQNQKILPKTQKQQIKQNDAQRIAQMRQNIKTFDQQIKAARKRRLEKENQAVHATQVKKAEKKQEVVKKQDKWAALKAMIKANQGSKEGNTRASG